MEVSCLGMQVDKVEGDTQLKKPEKRKKNRRPLKRKRKSYLSSLDSVIVDQPMTVLSLAPVQECLVMGAHTDDASTKLIKLQKKNRKKKLKMKRIKNLESLEKREGTENPEPVSAETGSGKTVTDDTTSKKRKRNRKAKKTLVGNDLKTKVTEGSSATQLSEAISGEMVLAKTDVKMVSQEEEHTEAVNGKMGSIATMNLNLNDALNSRLTIGEILTPQNLKADNGETGTGSTAADTTASKKKRRAKKKKQKKVAGDVLSTCDNIQDKLNAEVLDTRVTNKTELIDMENHIVDGNKGPEVFSLEQKTKKQKVDVNPSENKLFSKVKLGKKLIIFEVNGVLADIVHTSPNDAEADKCDGVLPGIVYPCPNDSEPDKYFSGKAVYKRPYLDDFLSFCFEKFNVGVWSSRKKNNLDLVVHYLLGDIQKKLLFTWDASHCTRSGLRNPENCRKFIVFKELRKIWEKKRCSWVKGFNISNTLLLDDSPYKALRNPKHTAIFPTSYKYKYTNDDCLGPAGALRAYLEGYAAADDGRTYVEQNPFGKDPIDERNPYWKYHSNEEKESDKQKDDDFDKIVGAAGESQKVIRKSERKYVGMGLSPLVRQSPEPIIVMESEVTSKVVEEKVVIEGQAQPCEFVFQTKEGATTISDNMQTLTPELEVEAGVVDMEIRKPSNEEEKKDESDMDIDWTSDEEDEPVVDTGVKVSTDVSGVDDEKKIELMKKQLDLNDEVIAKYLSEIDDVGLTTKEKAESIELMLQHQKNVRAIKQHRQHLQKATRNERRRYYMRFLKNQCGCLMKDFQKWTFEDIEKLFVSQVKNVERFVPMGSERE